MKRFIGFREKDAQSWLAAFERGEAPSLRALPLEMYLRFFHTDAPQAQWLSQHGYTLEEWDEAYAESSDRVDAWIQHLERRSTRIRNMLAQLERTNSPRVDTREKCALLLEKAQLHIEMFAGLFDMLPELLERRDDHAICAPRWSPTAPVLEQPLSISFSLDELLEQPLESIEPFLEQAYKRRVAALKRVAAALYKLERERGKAERFIRAVFFGATAPAPLTSFNDPPSSRPLTFCPQLQPNAPCAL